MDLTPLDVDNMCDNLIAHGSPIALVNQMRGLALDALRASAEGEAERVAQLTAHRACCGTEHDPANGKLHGYCVVYGVPWPCAYAGTPPVPDARPAPSGYVLVPEEPTEAMVEAACALMLERIRRRMRNDNDASGAVEGAKQMYRAMLAAAPVAGEGKEGE